jgi:hypothetical protein
MVDEHQRHCRGLASPPPEAAHRPTSKAGSYQGCWLSIPKADGAGVLTRPPTMRSTLGKRGRVGGARI